MLVSYTRYNLLLIINVVYENIIALKPFKIDCNLEFDLKIVGLDKYLLKIILLI